MTMGWGLGIPIMGLAVLAGGVSDLAATRTVAAGSASDCRDGSPPGAAGVAVVMDDAVHGFEPWMADASTGAMRLVADINPSGSSDPELLGRLGATLLFIADDGVHGRQLMSTHGDQPGATVLTPSAAPADATLIHDEWDELDDPQEVTARSLGQIDGDAIVSIGRVDAGIDLWRTDGSTAGTTLIGVIPRTWLVRMDPLGATERLLYFSDGSDLWVTDGTGAGTRLLVESAGLGQAIGLLGDRFLFTDEPDTGEEAGELWVTDGSVPGTRRLSEVRPWQVLGTVADRLVFAADDGVHGLAPWVTDGTPEGTGLLLDIEPDGTSWPQVLESTEDGLLLGARDRDRRHSVWITDGTRQGTRRVGPMAPEAVGPREEQATAADRRYFFAWHGRDGGQLGDGTRRPARAWLGVTRWPYRTARRLWKLPAAPSGYVPAFLGAAGDRIVFAAVAARRRGRDDLEIGVWSSDGTPGGAVLLVRLAAVEESWSGDSIAIPSLLTVESGDHLLFHDPAGKRLWRTDGTRSGTTPMASGEIIELRATDETACQPAGSEAAREVP